MSEPQERLWSAEQMATDEPTSNTGCTWRLDGEVDVERLRAALRLVVERHEVLRTVYDDDEGQPLPRVLSSFEIDLTSVDLRLDPARDTTAAELLRQARRRRFDLAVDIPLRALLLRSDDSTYRLSLVFHHIAVDGPSIRLIWDALVADYDGAPEPSAPAVRYADFAQWEAEQAAEADLPQLSSFWQAELGDLPDLTTLPYDFDRPRQPTGHGRWLDFELDQAVSANLTTLAAEAHVSLFVCTRALFAVAVSTWAGVDELVTGTPVTRRVLPEWSGLVGYLVETLPLRSKLEGDPTLAELLRQQQTTWLDAVDHLTRLTVVVDSVAPSRSSAHAPLFQVLFAYTEREQWRGSTSFSAAQTTQLPGSVQLDLEVELELRDDRLGGLVGFNVDLFDESTVARFVEHLQEVCAAATSLGTHVSQVVQTAGRQRRPAHAVPPPRSERFVDTLSRFARDDPSRPALSRGARSVSYLTLEKTSSAWAHALVARGLGAGARVALLMSNGDDVFTAAVACWKAGCVPLPVDPAAPPERVARILDDARAALVLADDDGPPLGHPVVPAATFRAEAATTAVGGASLAGPAGLCPSSPAYVVYTSGSTGSPKGIEVPWAVLDKVLDWDRSRAVGRPRCLSLASVAFDVFWLEVVSTLQSGGTVCFPEPTERQPDRLVELVEGQGVTRLFSSPALFRQLAEAWALRGASLPVREVLLSGDVVRPDHFTTAFLHALAPGARLENQYGPSETHHATSHVLDADPSTWDTAPPIGQPVDGTTAYVLDRFLQPVPPGGIGELYLGGPLAHGYVSSRSQTAARFLADPFAGPGSRMYRTGDLARLNTARELCFLGRADAQISLNGFRVEPREVEAALEDLPDVRHAVVRSQTGQGDDKSLTAWVTTSDSARASSRGVQEALRSTLPNYMVPTTVRFLDRLPLTSNGKLDERALRSAAPEEQSVEEPTAELRSDAESLVAAAFHSVLGTSAIGRHSDFFALGGTSVQVPQLLHLLPGPPEHPLDMRDVYNSPSVAELAGLLSSTGLVPHHEPALVFRPRGAGRGQLFCLPPVTGLGWSYAGLVAVLAEGSSVVALQDPWHVHGPDHSARSLRQIAAYYVEQVLERSGPPYDLLGWSFGGLVAHQVAVDLQSRDLQVGTLCIVDAYPVSAEDDLSRVREELEAHYVGLQDLPEADLHKIRTVAEKNVRAMVDFEPSVFAGEMILVSAEPANRGHSRSARWDRYVDGSVTVVETPLAHQDMLTGEGRQLIAEALSTSGLAGRRERTANHG